MPWITRAKKQKSHECARPELRALVRRRGSVHPAWLADPGDEWACRWCGKVWRVIEKPVAPPGWKGDRSKLRSTIIEWELTSKEWK